MRRQASPPQKTAIKWYDCDFPLFSLLTVVTWFSCREILIWFCVYSLCLSSSPSLCLMPLPLYSDAHLPHISVPVPGCWHYTDGPGSGKNVNMRERCLSGVLHCQEEVFLLVLFFALSHSIIAHWNLFFKLWKLPVSANCGSVYRFLSHCWILCADSQTQFTSDFVQTSLWYLAVSLLFCRLNLVLSLWMQSWRWYQGSDMTLSVPECLLEIWASSNQTNLANNIISH